jgi:hypothetical protein
LIAYAMVLDVLIIGKQSNISSSFFILVYC